MNSKKEALMNLVCHNCGNENPPKTYCCLKCFKVLRPKEEIPFWKIYVRPGVPMLIAILLLSGVGIYAVKKWMENIEAQVTMNFKSADYNLRFAADKKKKAALLGKLGISSDSTDAPEKTETTDAPVTDPAAVVAE